MCVYGLTAEEIQEQQSVGEEIVLSSKKREVEQKAASKPHLERKIKLDRSVKIIYSPWRRGRELPLQLRQSQFGINRRTMAVVKKEICPSLRLPCSPSLRGCSGKRTNLEFPFPVKIYTE